MIKTKDILKSEIKNNVNIVLKLYAYECNNKNTRQNITKDISSYLMTLQNKKHIYSFKVICDESNNTPDIINENKLVCDVGIKFNGDRELTIFKTTLKALTEDYL